MTNDLPTTVAGILQALQGAAQQYGPQALDTALALKRLDGLQGLGLGVLALIVGCLSYLWVWRRARRNDTSITNFLLSLDNDLPYLSALGIAGGGLITAAIQLLNIWSWVAVFRPELALAHDILEKLSR